MNKYIFSFFVFLNTFAQNFPIAESNAFVYNKSNFGNDFFNMTISPFSFDDGSVIVQPYADSFILLGNHGSHYLFKRKDGMYSQVQNTFQHKDTTWIVEKHRINCLINKKLKTSYKVSESINNVHFYKQKIYFLKHSHDYSKTDACVFDNGKITVLKTISNQSLFQFISYNNQLLLANQNKENNTLNLYEVKNKSLKLFNAISLKTKIDVLDSMVSKNHFYYFRESKYYVYDGKEKLLYDYQNNTNLRIHKEYLSYTDGETANIINKADSKTVVANTTLNSIIVNLNYSKATNSFYCGTNVGMFRLFPHVKKYPRIYNNSNTNAVFGLTQNKWGKIYACSYNGGLSLIEPDKIMTKNGHSIVNAMNYKGEILLFYENQKGAVFMNDLNEQKKIADSVTFFYGYNNKERLYLGSSEKGLWYKNNEDVYNPKVKWQKIDSKNNYHLKNTLSITEDKNGVIWAGSGRGIAFYNPKTDKATTWTLDKGQIPFRGSMTFLKDHKETLWIGTLTGELYYFDAKDSKEYKPEYLTKIEHPLLEAKNKISFIHQWKDYLVLGATDKVLLFDLNAWYLDKKILIKYLNPLESNFSNSTEQNTVFTDFRDQSLWFATSDMVYQWDVEKWMSLPNYNVTPSVVIKSKDISKEFSKVQAIHFKPTENSFDIAIHYQSKDNLPRYVSGCLVKNGEKPQFEYPNLNHDFHFANLSPGEYVFYARICQQDGSYTIHEYNICVDNFLYQKWWFWALILLLIMALLRYFYRQKLESERTKKKMSQLNLASLSNQFRPHFMLNALNSIGSQMEEMPHAEKIISRLGDSINILYGFSQKNEFTHLFTNEWKLTDNIIEILKTIYIPHLGLKISGLEILKDTYKIPIGLIQIPVENALLHGLRNIEKGTCILEINITENTKYYIIDIKDNGIGREKSKTINTFKKNGNGLKTIQKMITIINNYESNAILFEIIDLEQGTEVIIKLKKDISYERIVL